MIYDITHSLSSQSSQSSQSSDSADSSDPYKSPEFPAVVEWPGDVKFQYQWGARLVTGDSVNLGAFTMSVHLGTHMDAPYHYSEAGATVEQLDPAVFVGPARLVDMTGRQLITVEDFMGIDLNKTPRLLIKTDSWLDTSKFPEDIPLLDRDVPDYLRSQGVFLVGVDVPSMDRLDSKDLPIHHALGKAGITILESLKLHEVPADTYELIALPLKLAGADGSPVRAILRKE